MMSAVVQATSIAAISSGDDIITLPPLRQRTPQRSSTGGIGSGPPACRRKLMR
jgi:hypothetical protein